MSHAALLFALIAIGVLVKGAEAQGHKTIAVAADANIVDTHDAPACARKQENAPDYVEEYLRSLESCDTADYKTQIVRGIPQNPTFDPVKYENVINEFETKDGDVFLATYIRSGTTWTQQIIHSLLRQGKEGGKYGESVPWLEACAASPDMVGPREAPGWTMESINAAPAPRYFKTHATVEDLPRGKANIKTIIVARNPKDTAVSAYHHAKSKPEFGYTGDFIKFCEIFLAGKVEDGSWFDHVLNWYNKSKREPLTHLFLQYEDMYDDLPSAVKRIAVFLGIPISDEILARVVQAATIDGMKAHSNIGMNHLRHGGYGNWRDTFTVRLSETFDDVYKYKMKGSGLTFKFGKNSHSEDVIM